MPSSPGYVRNYAEESKTAKARGEIGGHDSPHSERMRARRAAVKMGMVRKGDGKDLDHRNPLGQGGSNRPSNWRVRSPHANRGFARNSDGSMRAGANG